MGEPNIVPEIVGSSLKGPPKLRHPQIFGNSHMESEPKPQTNSCSPKLEEWWPPLSFGLGF